MDVRMPVLDGVQATRRITTAHPRVRVVVLTTFELDEYVFDSLRAGASGFLGKDVDRTRSAKPCVWSPPARHCSRPASPAG